MNLDFSEAIQESL